VTRRGDAALASAAAISFLAALLLAWAAPGFDEAVLRALAPAPDWAVPPLLALTRLGNFMVLGPVALIVAVLLLVQGRSHDAMWLGAGVLLLRALVETLKLLIARARPAVENQLDLVHSMSFPSGHAANTLGTAVLIALLAPPAWRRRAMAIAVVVAVAVGITRPVLLVHWPTDVVGGWALAGGFALLWRRLRPSRP